MADPKIIESNLCQIIEVDGQMITVEIYRLEDTDWQLELVDEDGTSVVWEETFKEDAAAFDEATKSLKEEGLSMFAEELPNGVDTIH